MTAPPPGFASNEERSWVLFAHFGGIVLLFIAPMIALQVKGDQSPRILAHATRALNFQITWGLGLVVAFILEICTFHLLWFAPLLVWLFIAANCVIGGLRANEGRDYTYPWTLQIVQ
jgi:uncharacterized Tic20 family protein